MTVYDGQVNICPSEPEDRSALLRDQAKRVHSALGRTKGYFMSHDEIRVLNWDKKLRRSPSRCRPLLADNVKTCIADILRLK